MSENNKEMIVQLQRFTASSISMLNLCQAACEKQSNEKLSSKEVKSKKKFIESSQNFIEKFRDQNGDIEYGRYIKKAFSILKVNAQCDQLLKRDATLFSTRNENNKIVTILPGIDFRFAYSFLDEKEQSLFWQYMHLFSSS